MAIGVEKKVKGVGAGMEMEAKKSRWILGKKAFFKNLIFLFKIYFSFFYISSLNMIRHLPSDACNHTLSSTQRL